MKAFKKAMDVLAIIEEVVMSVILIVVTVVTVANVTVRKLTTFQFAWSEELVINTFILLIMLGCALCVREGSMISLSLVFDRVSRKVQQIFVVIITIASLVFWGILLWTGWEKVLEQMSNGKRTFSLGIHEWIFTMFLPLGCIFLILHSIEWFLDEMHKYKEVKTGGTTS